jgi:hypothetical protein
MTDPAGRLAVLVSLSLLYLTLLATTTHAISNQTVEAYVLLASLLIAIVTAPAEYALGAVGAAFIAASASDFAKSFLLLRWVVLAASTVIFPLRFFLRARRAPGRPTRFTFLLIVFLAVAALTLMTTAAFWMTALKLSAVVCMFFVAFQASVCIIATYGPASARRAIFGLAAFAFPFLLTAGVQSLFQSGRFFANPNTWGALLAILMPWMLSPLFRRTSSGLRSARPWWILGLLIASQMLLSTGSRAAMLGVLLAIAVACLVHADRRVAAAVSLAAMLIASAITADTGLLQRISERYIYKHQLAQAKTNVLQSRVLPWQAAQANVRQNPWLGIGFGVTSRTEASWSVDVTSARAAETGSSVWTALTEVGILGSAPLLMAIFFLLLGGARFAWQVKDPWFTGIYACALALCANGIFEGWLLAPGNFISFYFWIQCFFLNAITSRYQPAAKTAGAPQRPPLWERAYPTQNLGPSAY